MMTAPPNLDPTLQALVDDRLDQIDSVPQRRQLWPAWRLARTSTLFRLGIAAAVLVSAAILGYAYLNEDVGSTTPTPLPVATVATTDQLAALQRECRSGYVDPSLIQYAMRVVSATRYPDRYKIADLGRYISYGASPRATIHLIEGARALAFLRGRDYALPEDVTDLAPDVLRHRLVLSYEALADGLTADELILRILQKIPAPEKPLETHVAVGAKP